MAKADWSRPLARPIDVGKKRKLRTLSDVRAYLLSLPEERQRYRTWQYITELTLAAAQSDEPPDLTVPFALARMTGR